MNKHIKIQDAMIASKQIKRKLILIATGCITAKAFSASVRAICPRSPGSFASFLKIPGCCKENLNTSRVVLSKLRGGDGKEVLEMDFDQPPPTLAEIEEFPAIVESPKIASNEFKRFTPVPGHDLFSERNKLESCTLLTSVLSFGESYAKQLAARPIFTKSITAAIMFGLSDCVAQRLEHRGLQSKSVPEIKVTKSGSGSNNSSDKSAMSVNQTDTTRVIVSVLVGLCYFGPASHYWYEWVFRLLPSSSIVSTMQKAALGQIFFGPTFTCIFFATSLMQSGEFSLFNWLQKIKSDLFSVWAAGLGFWPIVDFVSYAYVPKPFIPLFVNSCSFLWTIYLSLVANRNAAAIAA